MAAQDCVSDVPPPTTSQPIANFLGQMLLNLGYACDQLLGCVALIKLTSDFFFLSDSLSSLCIFLMEHSR